MSLCQIIKLICHTVCMILSCIHIQFTVGIKYIRHVRLRNIHHLILICWVTLQLSLLCLGMFFEKIAFMRQSLHAGNRKYCYKQTLLACGRPITTNRANQHFSMRQDTWHFIVDTMILLLRYVPLCTCEM